MRLALGLACFAVVSGCKSADKKGEESLQSARSTTAAVLLTAEQGLKGQLSSKFLDDALQTSSENLDKSITDAPRASQKALHTAHIAVLDMQSAFNGHETTRVRYDVRILKAAQDSIEAQLARQ